MDSSLLHWIFIVVKNGRSMETVNRKCVSTDQAAYGGTFLESSHKPARWMAVASKANGVAMKWQHHIGNKGHVRRAVDLADVTMRGGKKLPCFGHCWQPRLPYGVLRTSACES
eukprot:6481747-Amphidinium_carterae.1